MTVFRDEFFSNNECLRKYDMLMRNAIALIEESDKDLKSSDSAEWNSHLLSIITVEKSL